MDYFFNDEKRARLLIVPAPFTGAVNKYINVLLHSAYNSETAEHPDPWTEQSQCFVALSQYLAISLCFDNQFVL